LFDFSLGFVAFWGLMILSCLIEIFILCVQFRVFFMGFCCTEEL
jgi:hypothetical protein